MLSIESEQVKSVAKRLSDAMLTIPLYDPEWTNFNPSDPGITVLETLSVSNIMLENAMDFMPPMVRLRLLAMAGIYPRKAKNAKVLIMAENLTAPVILPVHQRFTLGDITFETDRLTTMYGNNLIGAYTKEAGSSEYRDISYVIDPETMIPAYVFGKKPVSGNEVYFYADSLPAPGEDVICYASFIEKNGRNPLSERNKNMFATIVWECYCTDGFKELAPRDYTAGFLISGEIRFRMPENAAVFTEGPEKGYCIRARLTYSNYDIPPRLMEFSAFLFEVWQKDTKCTMFTFQKPADARVYSDLAETGYTRVYVKEKKGTGYRLYEQAAEEQNNDAQESEEQENTEQENTEQGYVEQGRFFEVRHHGFGQFEYIFDKTKYGFGPERTKNAVRVVTYTPDAMRQYRVGHVYGYDAQEIKLPYEHIVRGSFCLIAERTLPGGEKEYDFLRPEKDEEGSLHYHLLENEGSIVIEDAGDYIGADLYIASCATSRGDEGNVMDWKTFRGDNMPDGLKFTNPAPGVGGAYSETFDEMRARFLKDVHDPYVAVCGEDYETIAMQTPGLCISKAHAVMNEELNLVEVAVLPETDAAVPVLSETYKNLIMDELMERRLLTTRIELKNPSFVRVNIRGTVSVKRGFEKEAGEKVQECLKRVCEYRTNDKTFGEPLLYNEVYRALEAIEEVDYVYDLSLRPQGGLAKYSEGNVYPDKFVLCSLGNTDIEIIHS